MRGSINDFRRDLVMAHCLNVEGVKTQQKQTGVAGRRWPWSDRLHVCYDFKPHGSGLSLLNRSTHCRVDTLTYEPSQRALRCIERHNRMGTSFMGRSELAVDLLRELCNRAPYDNCRLRSPSHTDGDQYALIDVD